jgi:hypothetical protein
MSSATGNPVPVVVMAMWQSLRRYLVLMVLIFAVIYGAIGIGIVASGNVKQSVVEIAAAGGPKYVLFSYGLIMLTTMLPLYVSFGVTRRHYMLANVLFSLVVTVGIGVVLVAAFAIERYFLAANGLLAGIKSYPLHSWADVVPLFLQMWLVFLAHLVAAWLIAVGYWRAGPLWGTVLLPVAVIPAVGTEMLFGAEWVGTAMNAVFGTHPVPWWLATVGSLALCAAGSGIVYATIRRVPIGPMPRMLQNN